MMERLNQLFSPVLTAGSLPPGLDIHEILSKDFLLTQATSIYKQKVNTVVRLTLEEQPVVIKLFGWRNPLHYFLSPGMLSRAWLSWQTANALLRAGVRTPEPCFVYTSRKNGFIQSNVYITNSLEQHYSLRQFLNSKPAIDDAKKVIEDLAVSLARMHEAGIFHRDLTPGNILIDEKQQTYLVDLNRTVIHSTLTVSQRLRDLAKLNLKGKQPQFEKSLVGAFCDFYANECRSQVDWLNGYWERRRQLLVYRRRKAVLKRLKPGK